jgi:CMP-N-acetylneuraminic acid synthetase
MGLSKGSRGRARTIAAGIDGHSVAFAEKEGRYPVLPVAPYPSPIEWAFRKDREGVLAPLQPASMGIRSQDLETRFYDTGSFCVMPAQAILASEGAHGFASYIGFPLDRAKAVDIDDEADWEFAEVVFSGLRALGRK